MIDVMARYQRTWQKNNQTNKLPLIHPLHNMHYNKPTTYCVLALNLEYINGNRTATDVQVNLYGGYDCTDIWWKYKKTKKGLTLKF